MKCTSWGIWNYHWNHIFCIIWWWLWKWRNNKIFQVDFQTPMNRIGVIKAFVESNRLSWSVHYQNISQQVEEIFFSWKKPPGEWVKVNVDGSCDQRTGKIGAGGIIRDHSGKWMVGFLHNIGKGNSFIAKAWASLSGIQVAIDRGFSCVILESDSLEIVKLINDLNPLPTEHPLFSIVFSIRQCMGRLANVKVVHVFREVNTCADMMANLAIQEPIRVKVLTEPPPIIFNLIEADYAGVAWTRLCHAQVLS